MASDSNTSSTPLLCLRCAAVLVGLSVALGAFGAHALAERLGPDGQRIWQTAVRYQAIHGLALFGLAAIAGRFISLGKQRVVLTLFLVGTALFSGSLYAMALGAPRFLGAVTPLGGVAFLSGWATLAFGAAHLGRENSTS